MQGGQGACQSHAMSVYAAHVPRRQRCGGGVWWRCVRRSRVMSCMHTCMRHAIKLSIRTSSHIKKQGTAFAAFICVIIALRIPCGDTWRETARVVTTCCKRGCGSAEWQQRCKCSEASEAMAATARLAAATEQQQRNQAATEASSDGRHAAMGSSCDGKQAARASHTRAAPPPDSNAMCHSP